MSLSLALNNAISGLNVNQRALSTVSQNIANANTVGYSRKIIDQESQVLISGDGVGVRIESINRRVDEYLQKAVRERSSDVGGSNVIDDYMQRAQIFLGEPGAQNSVDERITAFFNSLQALAENPERSSFRVDAVQNGVNLASNISDMAHSLETLRYQADQDIEAVVDKINLTLQKLYDTNTAINAARAYGSNVSEIFDQRDRLLNELSTYVDAKPAFQADGQVFLYSNTGQTLLNAQFFQLEYTSSASIENFVNDTSMSAIKINAIGVNGEILSSTQELVSSGTSDSVTSAGVRGGELRALIDLRDSVIPGFLDQIDTLAAELRDQINAAHNQGSGFPGAATYTGTRLLDASDYTGFSGNVQIALLNDDGTPMDSLYDSDLYGMPPLNIDLSSLDGGQGQGQPTVQSIIDEINNYYGAPQNRVKLGDFNNIQLASSTSRLPNNTNQLSFDFDLSNYSGNDASFFITGVTVKDSTGTDITSVTSTRPTFSLASTGTYTTTNGSNVVSIATVGQHGLKAGDTVYLGAPSGAVNGIPAGELTGYFVVGNITDTSFEITTTTNAGVGPAVSQAGVIAYPAYDTVESGNTSRTTAQGNFTASLGANPSSVYYDITVNVGAVKNGTNNADTATITYRVYNNVDYTLNKRTSAMSATGAATIEQPNTNEPLARAYLVDINGNEIPTVSGQIGQGEGFLRIESLRTGAVISMDTLDSQEVGITASNGVTTASYRNFSHYFELNNFFKSNEPSVKGDTLKGSAYFMEVEERLQENPNLLTTGKTRVSMQPSTPGAPPKYTVERYIGENHLIQNIAALGNGLMGFDAAGGLPSTRLTFSAYSAEILGYLSARTASAKSDLEGKQILLDNFTSRSDSISGVNLDQELADTIVYQNAYSASARIVGVVNDLFDSLIGILQ